MEHRGGATSTAHRSHCCHPQAGSVVSAGAAVFDRFDVLACPVTQVPPFPVEIEWPRQINGVEMETYIDWMRVCTDISVTGCPSMSVPGGFTEDGLPVGLQLVGPHRGDVGLLHIAAVFEGATRFADRRPALSP